MTDKGIILNLEKPGDKNSFRVRKFSRNGSVSQRGDSEVRMEDDDAVKIEQLKQSIESEDEGAPKERLVVQNRSLERGFKQARFSQPQTSLVRESLDNAVQLMRVNVELDGGKQAQINRLPQTKKQPETSQGLEELRSLCDRQQSALETAATSNRTLIKFFNDFKLRFDRFKNSHKEFLLSSGKQEDGSMSARSSQSVNEDRPSSTQVIKRRIIRVDSHSRSSSRSHHPDDQTSLQRELDQKDQQIAELRAQIEALKKRTI